MKRVLIGSVLGGLLCVSAGGCVPEIDICAAAARDGILIEGGDKVDSLCEGVWFLDADRDGIGGSVLEDETDPRRSAVGGDCMDDDPGNFPGNIEVCDGADNDCFGGADYDAEGEEETDDGSYVYSCTPDGVPMQLFLLGGTEVNSWVFSRDGHKDIQVQDGDLLTGRLRLRLIVPAASAGRLAAAASRSWESPREDHNIDPWLIAGQGEVEPPLGITELDFELPEGFEAHPNPDSESAYVTIAGALAPDSEYVGSLTKPGYCSDEPPEQADCPPQWDGVPVPDPPPGQEAAENPDRDLADLDELDLAGCLTIGAARVSHLTEGRSRDPQVPRCSMEEEDCNPVFSPQAIGCTFIKLLVEE